MTMVGDDVTVTHMVARTREAVQSGVSRKDGLLGSARSEFDGDLPRRYDVRWSRADTTIALQVQRRGGRLQVSGTRTAMVQIPRNTRWAVADLGMEEHLIPTLMTLPTGTRGLPVAVFRPYSDRWDRMQVSVFGVVGATLFQLQNEAGQQVRYLVTETGDLLYAEVQEPGSQTLTSRRVPQAGTRREERLEDLLVLARSQ
jgi:hypothetical protein